MIERISKLTELVVSGKMYTEHTPAEFDRNDIFLPPLISSAKRSAQYILAQKPIVNEYTALTGYLKFEDDDVCGDIFKRCGHKNWKMIFNDFYNKPVDELCTFEWQHCVADFEKVIKCGISGLKKEIAESEKSHTDSESREFLEGLRIIAGAIVNWAHKCSDAALDMSVKSESPEAKKNLKKLSDALLKVPENPASSFYEAVLTVFVVYAFVPDSIGTIDRYLYPFYAEDKKKGVLTDEDAKAYLQELFLMLQARISPESDRFYRGGESHFCVGGYLENGEDGFNELSRLIAESMLELPTWIPQISLRWTDKTPREVLRFMMDCERKDPNKRIAFANDVPRIKAFMELADFPYELACKYTMVGCNEPQLPGGIFMGGCKTNVAKSVEKTFFEHRDEILKSETFDDFYRVFEKSLYDVLSKGVEWYNKFQSVRARDVNLVSTMFFEGSIERAKSITQGGAKNAIADLSLMGIVTVIDSLCIVRQFVFEEKQITMETLCNALCNNWNGFEELKNKIHSSGAFFGNNDDISNDCASRFAQSITSFFDGRKTDMGYSFMTGNLIGYNQHHTWFGKLTKATPDGRYAGEAVSYGIYQSDGKDREGITALLSSVAKINAYPIFCGQTVTNVLLEQELIKNDDNFEKMVTLFETYFKMGGLHFQLNYVSVDDLLDAKINPDKHKTLRVRVSGFSDYFNYLNDDLQDEIITRTQLSR